MAIEIKSNVTGGSALKKKNCLLNILGQKILNISYNLYLVNLTLLILTSGDV